LAVGIDTSLEALQLAHDNALACASVLSPNIPSTPTSHTKNIFIPLHADVRHTDTLTDLLTTWRPFHIITANPPYIPRDQYHKLDRSVKDFEDQTALLGDPPGSPDRDGLTFYFHIANLVARGHVLAKDGWLVLEVGDGQAQPVQNIVRSIPGIINTEIWTDPWGRERVVVARNHD